MSTREEIQPRPRPLDFRHLHYDARTWCAVKRLECGETIEKEKKSKNVGKERRVGNPYKTDRNRFKIINHLDPMKHRAMVLKLIYAHSVI